MAFKIVVVCVSALLIQTAFGQFVPSSATVTGNSVVTNDYYVSSPSQIASLGLPGLGGNIGGLASSAGGSLASGNIGLGGLGVGSNIGSNLAGLGVSGLASGVSNVVGAVSNAGGLGLAGLGGLGSGPVLSSPLTVTSISPISPNGLSVASENVIEGVLTVNGQLPFLSAVAFEGPLPTSGSGVATCGCGSGNVGIVGEGVPQGQAQPSAIGVGRNFI